MTLSRTLRLAAALSVAAASAARAENWAPFFMAPNNVEIDVDRDSVQRAGGHVQARAQLWFGVPSDMPLMDNAVSHIVARIEVACREQTFTVLSRAYFDRAGVPILNLPNSERPANIQPKSFEEQLAKTYCG